MPKHIGRKLLSFSMKRWTQSPSPTPRRDSSAANLMDKSVQSIHLSSDDNLAYRFPMSKASSIVVFFPSDTLCMITQSPRFSRFSSILPTSSR